MTARFPPIQFLAPALLLVLLLTTCSGIKSKSGTATETPTGLHPIDIWSPKFFWLVQPWKEGKLATIDGWGRFSEISFVGARGMRIKPLCNFPRTQLDRQLQTWPEAGLISSKTADRMHHLAAIDDGKTKSHIPLLTWGHTILDPVLLDSREGLVGYGYSLKPQRKRDLHKVNTNLFVYNYKEDKMVFESPGEGFAFLMILVMDSQYALSWERVFNGVSVEYKKVFYNWKTNEVVENDLTKALNRYNIGLIIEPCRNIHLAKRYLFGYSTILGETVMITWDEAYSDIKVISLKYLRPAEGIILVQFLLSADGMWASAFASGYRGLSNERLNKRAFFHMDERYPNGISIPIITEDYEELQFDYSAFVEHPVHGMCFAQEWHKKENGIDQLYLRLYRMEAVLAEINRRLAEEQ
jgi:hypothetical protein